MTGMKMGGVIMGLGFAMAAVLPVFAMETTATGSAMTSEHMAPPSTARGTTIKAEHGMMSANATTSAAAIACVGAAVGARETALGGSVSTYSQSVVSAYSARATSLQQAYMLTTGSAVKAAVKSSWSTFTSTIRSARSAWSTGRSDAWKTFRTAAAACKAPNGTSDSSYSESTSN